MTFIWLVWLFLLIGMLCGVLMWLYDGSKLQPTYKEMLIRHAEEQHAAMMRGDTNFGTYGVYFPADLDTYDL